MWKNNSTERKEMKKLPNIPEETLRSAGFSDFEVEIYKLLKKSEGGD